jgi:hypothetical protein
LVVAKKGHQQARKDNQVLVRYINAKRKKEETRKKEEEGWKKSEEEIHKKAVMEGQSSKDVRI